jgi:hypothetical protein
LALRKRADAVEKCHGVAVFAIGGVFGLFLAGRWSQIGKHHAQPGKFGEITSPLDYFAPLFGM